jgi:hypothetical protein
MKASEIIKADSEARGVNPTKTLVSIQYILMHKLGFILKKHDTVLLVAKISDHVYETHLFTTDSALTLSKAMVSIYHDLKKLKVKKIYGKADNSQIINLLKKLAVHEHTEVLDSDRPDYNWMIKL